jgi:hypothetical protein
MSRSAPRDDRIFSEVEKIVVVLLMLHLLLWLCHYLLMIALISDGINVIVHEALPLEEVLPPLLLLDLLLALVQGESLLLLLLVLGLNHIALFELLQEFDQLIGGD